MCRLGICLYNKKCISTIISFFSTGYLPYYFHFFLTVFDLASDLNEAFCLLYEEDSELDDILDKDEHDIATIKRNLVDAQTSEVIYDEVGGLNKEQPFLQCSPLLQYFDNDCSSCYTSIAFSIKMESRSINFQGK